MTVWGGGWSAVAARGPLQQVLLHRIERVVQSDTDEDDQDDVMVVQECGEASSRLSITGEP